MCLETNFGGMLKFVRWEEKAVQIKILENFNSV